MKETQTYDVVRKYVKDYANAMTKQYDIEMSNLTWDEAQIQKDNLNMYHLDDITQYYFIITHDKLN